jgi:DNA repair exonuclease SbcCD ATPase subunit
VQWMTFSIFFALFLALMDLVLKGKLDAENIQKLIETLDQIKSKSIRVGL